MTASSTDNRFLAIASVLAAVGFASTQDAVVKTLSGGYPAYETLMFRCVGSVPVLAALLWWSGSSAHLMTPLWPQLLLRGCILAAAYLSFVLAIAAMPIAKAVAIYFTMPFFVAGLAGPILGERVRIHRWLAIIAGFFGVLIMVRPGTGVFEPASIFALVAAFGYALGQMIGRPISQQVAPIVMAVWQNAIYFTVSLALALLFNLHDFGTFTHPSMMFLSRPIAMPNLIDTAFLLGNGVFAAFGMICFVTAYKYAESNFVAPFEYSSMIWALSFGLLVFGDFPDRYTWIGAGIVITAGLLMILRDRYLDRIAA